MIRYCLPLIVESQAALFQSIQAARSEYDFFEVWLDYLEDVDERFCASLSEMIAEERLIFLFRRKNLEAIKLNVAKRFQIMQWLDKRSAFLDLDITSQREEIEYIKKNKLRINSILSYHNYSATPPEEKLRAIIDEMCGLKAGVVKISTLCRTPREALTLLKLGLELEERGLKHIVLGMGDHGKITRIFGTLWGNMMVFAPRDTAESSAPGQLTRSQLNSIFKELVTH